MVETGMPSRAVEGELAEDVVERWPGIVDNPFDMKNASPSDLETMVIPK